MHLTTCWRRGNVLAGQCAHHKQGVIVGKLAVKKASEGVLGAFLDAAGRQRVRFEIDTAWLKGQLIDKYGDRGWGRQTAKAMGIGTDTVSRLVNDGREWKPHHILAYQAIIRKPLDEIMAHLAPGMPVMGPAGSAKVTGHVGADGVLEPGAGIGRRSVPNPPGMLDVRALTVIQPGSAMDGWVLYFGAPAPKVEDVIGKLCVVRRQFHDDVMVGVLRQGSGVGLYGLAGFMGINPGYQESRLIDAAQVVWVQTG